MKRSWPKYLPSHFSWGSRVKDKLSQPGFSGWELGLICVALNRWWWKGPCWAASPVSSTATCWKKWPEGAFLGLHSPITCPGNIRAYLEEGACSIRERHGRGKYLETGNQKDHNISLCEVNIKPISNTHATLTALTIGRGVAFIRNDPVAHLHHKSFTRTSLLQGCPCQGHARTL